jgi:quercetin dioxygenase-like cupin family protein
MSEPEIIHNPVTGETLFVLESTPEIFRFAYRLGPGGAVSAAHYHPSQQQKITVLAGRLHCRVGRAEREFGAGDSIVIPAGVAHDQWNPTATEVIAIEEHRPGHRIHAMFRVVFALARDGRTDRRGFPRPLVAAAFLAAFKDVARPAKLTLRVCLALLAPVSRLLGYGRLMDRYLREFETGPARGQRGPLPGPTAADRELWRNMQRLLAER